MVKLIAVCGLKRSGKDTIANYIAETYGFKTTKIADPLKKVCKILFDFSDDQLETDMKEQVDHRWGVSPRKVMQYFGTEILQHKIEEFLPGMNRQLLLRACKFDPLSQDKYVISDMRFIHEYEYLKQIYPGKTSIIIKVVRPEMSTNDQHSSEQEWNQIPHDCIIHNDGSIETLYKKVSGALSFMI